jgi:hypothetical protein
MTGNRFDKVDPLFVKGFFDGAPAYSLRVVTGKDTVFSIHKGGDRFAAFVGISHSLLINHFLSLGRKVVPKFGQEALEQVKFVFFQRRTGVAVNTAITFASRQIAKEIAFDQV